MKKIYQLKTILNVVIVFSIVVMTVSLLGFLYGIATNNLTKMNVTVLGQKMDHITVGLVVVASFVAIGYGLFIYAIYQLKKLVDFFIRRQFFSDLSVKTLKSIGFSMLGSSVLIRLPAYIYGALNDATIHLTLSTIQPESMVFSIIISLFFIILSYIFNEAKTMKEENELTI